MLFRTISKLVSSPSSLFKVKFTGNISESALTSLLLLTKLEKPELQTAIDLFRSKLFTDLPSLPKALSPHLSSRRLSPLSNTYTDLFSKLMHIHPSIDYSKSVEITPNTVSESLKTIYEFIDKGKVGFLSGDFSIELIEKLLNHIAMLEKSSLEENIDYFKKVEEYIRDQEFCLPKHGIPYPFKENPQAIYIRESFIERDSPEIVMKSLKNENEVLTHSAFSLNYLTPKEHLIEIYANLCSSIRREQSNCLQKNHPNFSKSYAELLINANADKLSIIILTVLLDLSAKEFKDNTQELVIKYSTIIETLSKSIFKQLIEDKTEQLCESLIKKKKTEKKYFNKSIQSVRSMVQKDVTKIKNQFKKDNAQFHELSGVLVKSLLESVKIKDNNNDEELIRHDYISADNKVFGVIRISKVLIKMLMGKAANKGNSVNFLHLERVLPMICPPMNWIDWETGGYIYKGFSIMRTQGSRLQKISLEKADLSKVSNVLNILGRTPWRINKDVLSVVEGIYNLGGGLGEIPIVDRGDKFVPDISMKYMQKQRLAQQKRDNWSLLCDFELKLGIARRFKEVERFYLPLNFDFRGRIYPISPHLNQIGNDLSRGLMEFANGKPLGKKGVYWLKIHLANKMGHDKLQIRERLEIIEKLMPDIKKMAKDPIGNQGWLQYEDPWQSLATIIELTKALESANPEDFISHLHIHQDGSCNGLQHYAALGRDIEGAEQVNLVDLDKPGDLYTAVAINVQQIVDSEALNGNELAQKLKGKIKRKIVKQTVMTSVYGVTFIGARDQILKQLKERVELEDEDLKPAAVYLAKITMKVLSDFFQGAQRIKLWLIDCAKLIAKSGHPVTWITPLGLPVVQPYRKGSSTMFIDTYFQRVSFEGNKDSLPISVPKQKSAFPPNFVHSLDSTHLMLTATECHKQGIEFAAVHDSFWTHACDIDELNIILRQQFVHLHSLPILENLLKDFRDMYPSIKFKEVPEKGKFQLSGVLSSTYFFA